MVLNLTGFDRPKENYLLKYVVPEISTKWYQIGTELCVHTSRLKIIEKNNPQDVEACTIKMLQFWLQKEVASWNQLIEAIKSAKLEHLASEIKKLLKGIILYIDQSLL